MEKRPPIEGLLYRRGPHTMKNLTPRPGKDTMTTPGRAPGLSTYNVLDAPGKVQVIAIDRLKPPLGVIPDDPAQGGDPGHVSIVPLDATGKIDQKLLEEWAATRDQDNPHPFTQIIIDAIVREERGGRE